MIRYEDAGEHVVHVRGTDVALRVAGNVEKLIDDYVEAQACGLVPSDRSPFGAVLWPSGRAFLRYWDASGRTVPDAVFELGCGVGLVSGYFAGLGSNAVVASDYEPALEPFVRENARRVCAAMGAVGGEGRVSFRVVDWTAGCPEDLRGSRRFLVATDVLYEDPHVEFLPRIASQLLHPEGDFYLADPERYRFATAMENVRARFAHVEMATLAVENGEDDASRGVVNTATSLTKVHVLRCRGPR